METLDWTKEWIRTQKINVWVQNSQQVIRFELHLKKGAYHSAMVSKLVARASKIAFQLLLMTHYSDLMSD